VSGDGVSRTITVEIKNVGRAPWVNAQSSAFVRAWAVDPNGDRFSVASSDQRNYDVPTLEPGQHYETTFAWRGPVNPAGWTILIGVCLDQPGWDRSLANNTVRTDDKGNVIGDPPAYDDVC
jgi:hypothetical protein